MLEVKLGKMLQTEKKAQNDLLRPYLRAAHIQPGGQLDLNVDMKEMWFSDREVRELDLRPGDGVIVEGGAGFGRAAYLENGLDGWGFQNSIIRLRGLPANVRYAVYALGAALEAGEIALACNAATFAHFTAEKVQGFRIPFHGAEEHARIVDYLDRETGEIDAMLAKLDGLTETLRLRRVRAIQSAVRSSRSIGIGLMLDVKLGKMLQTKPKSSSDRLQPYLRAAHIQPGGRLNLEIDTKEMYFSELEAETLSLRVGDAVIVEGGAGFGRAAYLTEGMAGWGFQNSIIRLRGASADTRYTVYALQAALESGEIAMACNAATFAHFTAEKVEGFRIPYHGTNEHRCIADHLDEATGKIDAMLAKIDELKALLVERRAALITDVVTGRKKIPS
jgi:type I restriction-modification system, specificity subunit